MNYFDIILRQNDKLEDKIDDMDDKINSLKQEQRKMKIQRKFNEVDKKRDELISPMIVYKFNLSNNKTRYMEVSKRLPVYEVVNQFELWSEHSYENIKSIELKESQLREV